MDKNLVQTEYEGLLLSYLRAKNRKDERRMSHICFGFKRCMELLGLHDEVLQAELNVEEMLAEDKPFFKELAQKDMRRKLTRIK